MPMPRPLRTTVAGLLAALAAGCSDSTAPGSGRQQSDLTILKLAPTAPPLLQTSVQFTACQGQAAEGKLFFDDGSGHEGEEFARLTIDAISLLARPDGTPFSLGDCVTITMSVADPASKNVLVQLEPGGLSFNPVHPAELRLDYGKDEGVDANVLTKVGIWRQEKVGDPFVLIGSAVLADVLKVRANLTGFSRYALAY